MPSFATAFKEEVTIDNREKGKSKSQAKAPAGWANVRGLGKREAWRRLELMGG